MNAILYAGAVFVAALALACLVWAIIRALPRRRPRFIGQPGFCWLCHRILNGDRRNYYPAAGIYTHICPRCAADPKQRRFLGLKPETRKWLREVAR